MFSAVAILALLQPLSMAKAANEPMVQRLPASTLTPEAKEFDANAAETEAVNLGYSWPMSDLTSLSANTFLPSIDNHALSVVVFHTKLSPTWPLVRAVLKTAKANFTERHPEFDVQWAQVDLEKSPRLSTFSHYNTIDVMFFFPDLALFPIRAHGNLSVTGMLNETEYIWQYTKPGLSHWDNISQLVSNFVSASFKGAGDPQKSFEALELYYQRTKAYMELIKTLAEDQSELAARTNKAARKMRQFQSRFDDPNDFLQLKEEAFMLEQFLRYAFPKNNFEKRKSQKKNLARQKNRKPLVAEPRTPAVVEETVM